MTQYNVSWLRVRDMGGGTFCQSGGGAQVHVKNTIEKSCGFIWQVWRHKHWNMTSSPMHHAKV